MSPAERGGVGQLAALRGFGNRLAIDQRLRLIVPALPVMQSSQRCPGQRIESLAATCAAVPRLATGLAPAMDPIAAAMRAAKARYPIVPDLRQEILVRSGIGRPCDHNSGHRRGRASQRGVIGCVIRSFSWIIHRGQRQFPKRLAPLRRVQQPDPRKPLGKRRRVHVQMPRRPDRISQF